MLYITVLQDINQLLVQFFSVVTDG